MFAFSLFGSTLDVRRSMFDVRVFSLLDVRYSRFLFGSTLDVRRSMFDVRVFSLVQRWMFDVRCSRFLFVEQKRSKHVQKPESDEV